MNRKKKSRVDNLKWVCFAPTGTFHSSFLRKVPPFGLYTTQKCKTDLGNVFRSCPGANLLLSSVFFKSHSAGVNTLVMAAMEAPQAEIKEA